MRYQKVKKVAPLLLCLAIIASSILPGDVLPVPDEVQKAVEHLNPWTITVHGIMDGTGVESAQTSLVLAYCSLNVARAFIENQIAIYEDKIMGAQIESSVGEQFAVLRKLEYGPPGFGVTCLRI